MVLLSIMHIKLLQLLFGSVCLACLHAVELSEGPEVAANKRSLEHLDRLFKLPKVYERMHSPEGAVTPGSIGNVEESSGQGVMDTYKRDKAHKNLLRLYGLEPVYSGMSSTDDPSTPDTVEMSDLHSDEKKKRGQSFEDMQKLYQLPNVYTGMQPLERPLFTDILHENYGKGHSGHRSLDVNQCHTVSVLTSLMKLHQCQQIDVEYFDKTSTSDNSITFEAKPVKATNVLKAFLFFTVRNDGPEQQVELDVSISALSSTNSHAFHSHVVHMNQSKGCLYGDVTSWLQGLLTYGKYDVMQLNVTLTCPGNVDSQCEGLSIGKPFLVVKDADVNECKLWGQNEDRKLS